MNLLDEWRFFAVAMNEEDATRFCLESRYSLTSNSTIMKTKSLLATIGVCLTILTSTLVLIAVVVVQDNRELRRELRTLRADLHRASTEVGQWRAETADATTQLAAKHDELEQLEEAVASSKAASSKASDDVAASTAPRACRVRAYLGSQYLGMAWMVPSALPKDAESGRVLYEPVLVLDESLNSKFASHRTDVVEREVSRATTVNYNYAYPYYYPVIVGNAGNRPPGCDTNQAPVQPKPRPQLPPGIFNPANSKPFLPGKPFLPNEKPFQPGVNQVRTEPVRVQASLAPAAGNLRPLIISAVASRQIVAQPW